MNQIVEKKPMVSVVMITYNHEAFIAEAIEGVLMQVADYPIEFIIANDCSPDRTNEIVQNYINNHPNGKWITYTRHPNNKGMMPNFIWALEQAKGKYIALCEGDDYWTDPLKLQKQVDFLEEEANKKFVAVFHQVKLINEEKEFIGLQPNKDIKKEFAFNELIMGWFIPTCSIVFRNNLQYSDLLNFKHVISGDRLLTACLAAKGNFYYMNQTMGVYRKHSGGISSWGDKIKIFRSNKILFQQMQKYFDADKRKALKVQTFYWQARLIEEYRASRKYLNSYYELIKLFTIISSMNDLKTALKLIVVKKMN